MAIRSSPLAAAALSLALAACTGVRGLDEQPMALSKAERARVDAQVGKALEDHRWAVAWNQAVDAGAARERFETIALAALADASGDAEDMFAALLAKYGGLTPDARGRVGELVQEELRRRDWKRAVEIELIAAEDAPTYEAAWALYDDAPPYKAGDLLEMIDEARRERETGD